MLGPVALYFAMNLTKTEMWSNDIVKTHRHSVDAIYTYQQIRQIPHNIKVSDIQDRTRNEYGNHT